MTSPQRATVVPARAPVALDDMDVVLPRGRPLDEGTITLCGHVDRKVDDVRLYLRDRYGKTLVAVDATALPYVADRFGKVGPEDVVQVSGEADRSPNATRVCGESRHPGRGSVATAWAMRFYVRPPSS